MYLTLCSIYWGRRLRQPEDLSPGNPLHTTWISTIKKKKWNGPSLGQGSLDFKRLLMQQGFKQDDIECKIQ